MNGWGIVIAAVGGLALGAGATLTFLYVDGHWVQRQKAARLAYRAQSYEQRARARAREAVGWATALREYNIVGAASALVRAVDPAAADGATEE